MAEPVEHHSNRRYGANRRDIYLLRTATGWQVIGRTGGSDGQEVSHYFDDEKSAREMVKRMRQTVPPHLADWSLMPRSRIR
ncbi:hypothetical protein [Actinoplanes sp. URMC 104]|uniref:hypothetical protein n=1 Tax=Actinoplanes sp. URMC 104 TaxID=3423409 RepID=UPI003F1DA24F